MEGVVNKNVISSVIIFLVIIHLLDLYKKSRKTGEKYSSLLGGKFTLVAIVLLLLTYFQL
jgi:hypothetical protein